MSVVIPSSDTASTQLNGVITAVTANITAAGNNGPLVQRLTQHKQEAQNNLVLHLLGAGKITAASVLTNCTYGQ